MHRGTELFIDGQWTPPSTDAVVEVVSPHTEEVMGQAPAAAPVDVDRAVAAARAAFDDGPWRIRPTDRRSPRAFELGRSG
jgi:acyl-CoA reductase-like NAD-dependent aldehyde dehydrogenase